MRQNTKKYRHNSTKWLGLSVVLLSLSSVVAGFFFIEYANTREELKSERLHAESLLSSKVALQQKLDRTEKKNEKLEYIRRIEKEAIQRLNSDIALLSKENYASKSNISSLNQKIEQLTNLNNLSANQNNILLTQLDSANFQSDNYKQERDNLIIQKNGLLDQLANQNTQKAFHFLLEAFSGKRNAVTNKARKTNRIRVSFALLENLRAEKIHLVLSGPPLGKNNLTSVEYTGGDNSGEANQPMNPMIQREIEPGKTARQEVWIDLEQKLIPGIYHVDLFSGNNHLGGAQIRLK